MSKSPRNPSVTAYNVILIIFALFCGDISPFRGDFGCKFLTSPVKGRGTAAAVVGYLPTFAHFY